MAKDIEGKNVAAEADYSLLCAIAEAADKVEAEVAKTGEILSLVYAANNPDSLMKMIAAYGEANFALGEVTAEFNRLIEGSTDPEHVAEVAAIADRIQAGISRSYDAFVGAMRKKAQAVETTEALENGATLFDSATVKNPDLLPGEGAIIRQLITTFAAGLDRAFGQIEAIRTEIAEMAGANEERFRIIGTLQDKLIEAISSLERKGKSGPDGVVMFPKSEWENVYREVMNVRDRVAQLEQSLKDLGQGSV